jgi:hypothetical protein
MSIKDRVIFGSPKKNRHQNSIDQVTSVYFTQESNICIQRRVYLKFKTKSLIFVNRVNFLSFYSFKFLPMCLRTILVEKS